VKPAIKLIFTVNVTPEQRQQLMTKLAGALMRIDGTARVFGAATFQLVPVSAPVNLPPGVNGVPPLLEAPTGQLPSQVVLAAPILLPALRAYILRHDSSQRCSERIRAGDLPSVIKDFNYLISKLDPNEYLYKPITQAEVNSVKDSGTYVRHSWWESDRSRQVLSALQWLNHGNRNLPDSQRFFTPEERATVEWNTHFTDTLKLIEGWREGEEDSPEDWFGMVSEAYELLAEKGAPGKQRDAATSRYLNFMETNYTRFEHNLWFTQLHGQWRSKDSWMIEQFTSSANPVMELYASVTKRIAQ
jgi:hypothetical protein